MAVERAPVMPPVPGDVDERARRPEDHQERRDAHERARAPPHEAGGRALERRGRLARARAPVEEHGQQQRERRGRERADEREQVVEERDRVRLEPRERRDRERERGPRGCLLYTSPSPRDRTRSRMPSSA